MTEAVTSERRIRGLRQIQIGVAVLIIAGISYFWGGNKAPAPLVTNFIECAAQGFPIMESYPRQCRTADGRMFREDIGNELEKDDLIRISEPRPNATVASPLKVAGMARGNWFFEASFPVKLFDDSGGEIAHGIAQAKEEWMTTEFVPFEAILTFVKPASDFGTLVLEKDNPSGLPEHDDELRIPVTFEKVEGSLPPVGKVCVVGGCSGELCSDKEGMVSTCEFKEEYACYKNAKCERQASGKCGWTETLELRACIDATR